VPASDASLESKLVSPGFTPGARDVGPLVELLASGDDETAKRAERALSRAGSRALGKVLERFPDSAPPLRARLCAVVGRIFTANRSPELGAWLVERLADSDPKTKRRAASALGRTRDRRFEASLLAAFDAAEGGPERRAFAAALGSVGGSAALSALSQPASGDVELDRVTAESREKIERTLLRIEPGAVLSDVAPLRPLELFLHVRAGLEDLLIDEIEARLHPRYAGKGRVVVRLDKPLRDVYRARTLLHVAFPLAAERVIGGDIASAVVRVVTSDAAFEIFSTFTRGPIRYRLDWAAAGRKRATTFDVARKVRRARPSLMNDPTDAVWEVVVSEAGNAEDRLVRVALWPRALSDTRFFYRESALPASSHPTVAAALARVAGVRAGDVVWDPFAGAGTELIERALLGPYASLHGTDIEQRAIDAARTNLRAAGVSRFRLVRGDSRTTGPDEPLSLVITNPPFGKRTLRPDAIAPLLADVLGNVARRTREGGRVVWVSPMPARTVALADAVGFEVETRMPVDLGGVRAEIQKLVPKRGGRHGSRRKL
jgi:23S rRNA G2445 N2-methylase RlmL